MKPPIIILNADDILNENLLHKATEKTEGEDEWENTRRQLQKNVVKEEDEEPIGEDTANREKTSRDIRLYFENYED